VCRCHCAFCLRFGPLGAAFEGGAGGASFGDCSRGEAFDLTIGRERKGRDCMGMIILLAMVGLVLAFSTAIIGAASIGLGHAVRSLAPAIKLWLLALLTTGAVTLVWVAMLLMIPVIAIDGEFRGPEVLGFMILFAIAILTVVIAWPASCFFTYRWFRSR